MRKTPLKRKTRLQAKKPWRPTPTKLRRVRKVKEHERGQAVKVMPDGREICLPTKAGKEEYLRRTIQMWRRQDQRCALCGELIYYPTFDHETPRGMGSARRDDRISVDGRRQNAAVCLECNEKKGSKRVPYILQ